MSTKREQVSSEIEERLVETPTLARLRNQQTTKKQKSFIKGPIPLFWLMSATNAGSSALPVGLHLWFFAGLQKSTTVSVSAKKLSLNNMSVDSVRRGLRALEAEGLIYIERFPGRKSKITIMPTAD